MYSRDEDCFVDVIEVVDGVRIPFKKAMNKYIVKVESLDILKDGDVFLKAIDMCEKARIEEVVSFKEKLFFINGALKQFLF